MGATLACVCKVHTVRVLTPRFSAFAVAQASLWTGNAVTTLTGVYGGLNGQDHEGKCDATCATSTCAQIGTANVIAKCSGCWRGNPVTEGGCFPGAKGYAFQVATQHTVHNLVVGRTYYFRLLASNMYGVATTWSDSSYGLLTHTVPSAVSATATAVTASSVTLTWSKPTTSGTGHCGGAGYIKNVDQSSATELCRTDAGGSAPTGYAVYQKNSANAYVAVAGATSVSSSAGTISYTVSSLAASTAFTFKVTATNAVGANTVGGTAQVVATTLGKPDTPRAPAAIGITDNSIKLAWTLPASTSTITSYRVLASSCTTSAKGFAKVLKTTSCAWKPALRVTLKANTVKHDWLKLPDCMNKYGVLVNVTAAGSCSSGTEITASSQIQENEALCRHSCVVAGTCKFYSFCPSSDSRCTSAKSNKCKVYSACSAVSNTGTNAGFKYYNLQQAACVGAASGNTWTAAGSCRDSNFNLVPSLATEAACIAAVVKPTNTRPLSAALPSALSAANWLQLEQPSAYSATKATDQVLTVLHLSPSTKYKFRIAFTNAAGESTPSADSILFTTPEKEIKDTMRMSSGPPCVYNTPKKVTFAITSNGTNVLYRWENPASGSKIGLCDPSRADCSRMTYTFPSIGTHKVAVVASNTRGIKRLTTTYTVRNCGCTDIFDGSYWPEAVFSVPTECAVETWGGVGVTKVVTLRNNEFEYYQFFYEEHTHSIEVTARLDAGKVNVYVSNSGVPDSARASSYLAAYSKTGVSNFFVARLPYAALKGKRSIFIAVKGAAAFSRVQVISHKSDFATARTLLEDVVPVTVASSAPLLTGRYNFYEYSFAKAPADVDVEVTVKVLSGALSVYTDKAERLPSPLRKPGSSAAQPGYWRSSGANAVAAGASTVLVHTFKYEEVRRLFISVEGRAALTSTTAVSGKAAEAAHVGKARGETTYTITARVYRYRIESRELKPAGGTVSEDARYSTVSKDNFRYYEVALGARSASVKVDVVLHHGNVGLYTSFTKLPTRDPVIGYSAFYPSGSNPWRSTDMGDRTLSFTLSLAAVTTSKAKVYLGVYGLHADSAYKISVTENTLAGSDTLTTLAYATSYGSALPLNLVANKYYHVALQTAQADTAMNVAQRGGTGAAFSEDVTANTWSKFNGDKRDTDVRITGTVNRANVKLYASNSETYTSAERGYGATNVGQNGSPSSQAVSLKGCR